MKRNTPLSRLSAILVLMAALVFSAPFYATAQTPCTNQGQTVTPDAGTLTPDLASNCAGLSLVTLSATPDGNAVVPAGYQVIYVLTSGPNLVIRQVNTSPVFNVSGNNNYRIHTLVYDPATLDLSIVVPSVTTGFDVNALLVQGGGSICAALDVPGAQFNVRRPVAGTMTAVNAEVCAVNGTATVEAVADGNANVPYPFTQLYVLTSGAGLVIEQVNTSPVFTVTEGGLYTIHSLVYDPATLDLSIVVPGVTTGVDVNGLLVQGGGSICASLDVAGAQIEVDAPFAGTLVANPNTCSLDISATPTGNAVVPAGYQTIYVLTSGAGLVIEQVNATPDFTVTANGSYTIHTLVYDPNTLDLSIVVFGSTTGFDVNSLLVQGGGSICASLDVNGAKFNLQSPSAGTLTANATDCSLNISAVANGDAVVPAGYQTLYVLTSGAGLVIEQVNATPDFTVTSPGLYTIHTLVYNPATLDLSIVVPGTTTGFDVNGLLVQGGGSICASLDVAGAQFSVANPDAGTLTANATDCSLNISAVANGDAVVPAGYQTLYVLTSGAGLVIEQVNATPDFTVTAPGLYTIHTLVYNPATLDLSIVVPGTTTGFDVNGLLVQGGGSICASLDVAGAQFNVANPDAGTLTANATDCSLNISAVANGDAVVPAGYQTLYVLTSGAGLVIEQVNATPDFTVTAPGLYTIHTLVYNPATLDLSIVVPGTTTGFDVNGLLVQGGGSICASLDVAGAQFNVANPDAGTLTANATDCSLNISALANGDAVVPAGYQTLYVLTSGAGLVIEQVNATPDFTVTAPGLYTIHTLVYNPATLDLSIVVPGTTTGFDVNGLLVQGGGSICASLDVAGAQFNVAQPDAGDIDPDDFIVCLSNGSAVVNGVPQGNEVVPAGYQVLYVLTRGQNLVIQQVSTSPSFTVGQIGLYRIHTLVYNPATLNLSVVVPGVTTGFDVNGLLVQGGGSICASLDVQGAPFIVLGPIICSIFNLDAQVAETQDANTIEQLRSIAESGNDYVFALLQVYPNPASETLNLDIMAAPSEMVEISVLNMVGQTMMTMQVPSAADGITRHAMDVSGLAPGSYIIQVRSGAEMNTMRFVVN